MSNRGMAGLKRSVKADQTTQATIEGLERLQRAMKYMTEKGSSNIVRAMTSAVLTVVNRQIKKDLSPKVPEAKTAIRKRMSWKKTKKTAKVGVGVGKAKGLVLKNDRGKRGGVGIGRRNTHWWVIGSTTRKTKKGQNRGRMPAMQPGLAPIALSKSLSRAAAAMRRRGVRQLIKEAAKAKQ